MSVPDCSVVILNYNTKEWLERCVRSIFEHTKGIQFDVWVVDNASPDGSAEMMREKFPQARLIANPENVYVARGFNLGLRASQGRYAFIGDADLEFTDNLLGRMVEFMDQNKTLAALGCPFYYPDGRFFSQCYSRDHTWLFSLLNFSFLSKVFSGAYRKMRHHFEYGDWDRKSSRYVDIIDTAILYRRAALDQSGLYDEKFNFYGIQNDICLRIREAGWGLYYLYEGHLIHAQHQSVGKESWSKISAFYRRDIAHYLRKRYGLLASSMVMGLLQFTRFLLRAAIFVRLYKPRKNIAFGT